MMYVYDQPYARLELEDTINPQYLTLSQGDIRVANGEEVTFIFVIEKIFPGTVYEESEKNVEGWYDIGVITVVE